MSHYGASLRAPALTAVLRARQAASGVAMFAFLAQAAPTAGGATADEGAAEDVVLSVTHGTLTAEQYLASVAAARRGAAAVVAFARLSLERQLSR